MSPAVTDLTTAAAVAGRACVALVLATAGLQKLRHGEVLIGVVANYRILPPRLARPAALALPWAELAVAGLLLTPWGGAWTAVAAIGLMALFAAAMAVNIRRGRAHIDCGCHQSALRQPLRWSLVARNLILGLILVPSLLVPGLAHAAAGAGPALIGLAAGAIGFALYALFNTLAALPALDRSVA